MWLTSILFLFWRIGDLTTAYITKLLNKYNEHFIYRFKLYHHNPHIPKFLVSFANYDGAHYLHIAHSGYNQYEQAFFPLFPFLIHTLSIIFNDNYFLPGFFLANISFLLGLYFFKKYLEILEKNKETLTWVLLFLLTFPYSFFFGAVYTEGLFFLLVCTTLYFTQKKQYGLMIIFSVLASLTRFTGIFLIIPLLAMLLPKKNKITIINSTIKHKLVSLFYYLLSNKKAIFISLSPLLGLIIYMAYLFLTLHDPWAFYNTQSAFNNGRTIHKLIFLPQVYYRYLHIFFTARYNIIYFIAMVEFVIFNLFFIVLAYDLLKLLKKKNTPLNANLIGLNIFSFINLIIPTLTGTLTSVPRYALFSLSFFIRIAEIKNIMIRTFILIIFAIFHIILLSLFIQGYFVS